MSKKTNNVYNSILRKINRLKESTDITYNKETVKANKTDYFSIECIRSNECGYDYGWPIYFEIYYVKDGKDFDCCTYHTIPFIKPDDGLLSFVNMYI